MLFVILTRVSLRPRFTGWTGATDFALGATRSAHSPAHQLKNCCVVQLPGVLFFFFSFRVFLSALPVRWGQAETTLHGGQGCDLTSAWVELGEPTSGSSPVFLNSFSGRRGWAPWSMWWGKGAKQLLCWMWADQAAGLGDLLIWRPELGRLAPHPSSLARAGCWLGFLCVLCRQELCPLRPPCCWRETPPPVVCHSQIPSAWAHRCSVIPMRRNQSRTSQRWPPSAGGAGCHPCVLLCPWRSCRQGATLGRGPCGRRWLFLSPFLAVCLGLCGAGRASASFLCSEIRSVMSYSCRVVGCSFWEGSQVRNGLCRHLGGVALFFWSAVPKQVNPFSTRVQKLFFQNETLMSSKVLFAF